MSSIDPSSQFSGYKVSRITVERVDIDGPAGVIHGRRVEMSIYESVYISSNAQSVNKMSINK